MKNELQKYKHIVQCIGLLLTLILPLCSCEDYGKEIEDLKTQVSELQKAINDLKAAQESGKMISQVVASEESDGYHIVFSDGSKIILNHGNDGSDGADGADGADGSDGADGADGIDGNHGSDGVTPIIRIDSEGYWVVSYDNEETFGRILDAASNPIAAVKNGSDGMDGLPGEDGKSVRVVVDENGQYVFEIYSPSDPDEVIESIETPLSSNPSSAIASIVKNEENGKIILTMRDGEVFEFNLDVAYPTSLIVLEEVVKINAFEDGVLTFRFNPSNAYVSFILEEDNPTIELDVVSESSRSGENISYVNKAKGYKILSVKPDETEDGDVKQGQYKAEISSLNNGENPSARVCLVLTTKNSKGETIRLSSNPFTIINGEGSEIVSVTINGVEGVKSGNIFYVKLPPSTNLKELTPEFTGNSSSIVAKQEESSRAFSQTYDFSTPVTFVSAGPEGKSEEYTVVVTYSNLPVVYVTTSAPILSKDDWVKNSTIQIFNPDSPEQNKTYKSSIKGRGNSTWGYPKKPYAIKLDSDSKDEVLGMPKHKRWCLLANWMDRTNLRNDVAFEIGRRMTGLAWTPRGKFVDVVFNGKYVGNYYLCEQIKIDKNRVAIDEMDETDISEPDITGGYLLEFDTNFDEVNKFRTAQLNLPVNFKDPDEDVLQPAQFEYLQNYINELESKLISHAEYSEITELMDIDSYIDWWIVHELVRNAEPNHPKSSYMYKYRNGKLFAGPIWDFDWATFTSCTIWIDIETLWYKYLFYYPEFVVNVKERWEECRTSLAEIPKYIDTMGEYLNESGTYDCQFWPINPSLTDGKYINDDELLSYPESVERMKNMYIQRFKWIDENIGKLTATAD